MTKNQPRYDFETPPSAVSGNALRGERLPDGNLRLSVSYPVSIGGARIEQHSASVVLGDRDRGNLRTFLAREARSPAPGTMHGWTQTDLHMLIVTAGEVAATYGTGTDGLDRDDILSTRQRAILRRAARDYYAYLGELDSAGNGSENHEQEN